jgi:hypothetical protein
MPKYKAGKQENPLSFQEFQTLIDKAKLPLEKEAFMWLLYYTGARKSEVYERTATDCRVTKQHFTIDFRQRKKHGAHVPPIKFPRIFRGVEELIKLEEKAQRKTTRKRIFYQENRLTKSKVIRDHWLFPHIQSSTALRLVKEVLGSRFYPHYLRLNRLTEIGSDPEANIVRLKSYSGIKSIKALESYMGVSEEEQDAALTWIARRMKP